MDDSRRLPPVWLMGFCQLPLGITGAVALITVPQLLAGRGVAEPAIAAVTATALIPNFCAFLVSPILDWRFSRRFYAMVTAVGAALAQFAALMSVGNLPLLTVFLVATIAMVALNVAAVGGWLGSVTEKADKDKLGAWMTVANFSGIGVGAVAAIFVLRRMPFAIGAGLLSLSILAPFAIYPSIPAPQPDARLARESFQAFFRDVAQLLRRRTVLITLLLFVAPAASFALTNTLGGLGRDYRASEQFVGFVGGTGAAIAGIFGSLMMPPILKRLGGWKLYLAVGSVGALFTAVLIGLPRTPLTFGLAMVGENIGQAAAFAVAFAIILETIGEGDALAATQFALLNAATMLPLTYMQALDGAAYGWGGLTGALATDAGVTLVACAILSGVLWVLARNRRRALSAAP